MSRQIALIEPNNYHGEVLPPLAYLLTELGYKVTVYATPFVISQNPFVNLPSLDVDIKVFDGESDASFSEYDLLVWNSIEPERNIPFFQSAKKPALAVIHDGSRILSAEYKSVIESPHFAAITLSRHFSTHLKKKGLNNACIFPSYFNEEKPSEKDSNVFCVQGKVEFKRRNYGAVLRASAQLIKDSSLPDFKVKLLGKNNSIEGNLLRLRAFLSSARTCFEIPGKQPDYKNFYGHLLASDFICPLIDRSKDKYRSYFVDTSSSSIPIGLGHNLIPILHHEFASLYNLENKSITYREGELPEAMRSAMKMSSDKRQSLQSQIIAYREEELQRSLHEIEKAIKKVLE